MTQETVQALWITLGIAAGIAVPVLVQVCRELKPFLRLSQLLRFGRGRGGWF